MDEKYTFLLGFGWRLKADDGHIASLQVDDELSPHLLEVARDFFQKLFTTKEVFKPDLFEAELWSSQKCQVKTFSWNDKKRELRLQIERIG